jgi:hypothetical protein
MEQTKQGGLNMALEKRIESWQKRHKIIEDQLHSEEIRPAPDIKTIKQLKREKLLLKDEITKLSTELSEAA